MKRLMVCALIVLMCFTAFNVFAGGKSDSGAKGGQKPYHIILVNALVGHPVYEQQAVGARMAAKDYGVNLEIIGPTMGTSALVEETTNFIDQAITMKPDAIITEPWDATLNAPLQRVYNAKIPNFCTSNLPDNPNHFISWIGTDNYNYGKTSADMIAEKTGGKANVCIMMSFLDISNQVEIRKGFMDRIAEKYPGIKVSVTESDQANMDIAMKKFEEIFRAYREVDVVWMLEGTGGPAAAQVAQEMGRKVLILDVDAVDQTIDLIGKGQIWATLAQNFYKRGYESVRMAYEYLSNGNANSFEKYNDSGVVLINSSNVGTYEKDLMGAIRYKGTPLK
jgi:ABC-type sugar transport system substrate-binding protein